MLGLVTAKDLLKHRRHPFATGIPTAVYALAQRSAPPGLSRTRRGAIRAGADVLVIDIAHGHSQVMARAIEQIRKHCGDVELVAGNVATEAGALFLLDRGVNGIKVGIGPGGGCTTRLTTNFGIPQVEALVRCRLAVGDRVPLIADGGVKRRRQHRLALLFGGDCVMLGSAFAGTLETPGEVVLKSVFMPESQKLGQVPFKVFRGMASVGAVRDRLNLEEAATPELEAMGAEGLEVSVPARGSVCVVIHDMLKHLCSAISYGGATSLQELRRTFWSNPERYLVRLSEASRVESFQR